MIAPDIERQRTIIPSVRSLLAGLSCLGRRFPRDETASPAVEFALVSPIFLAVMLATLQAATIFLVKAFFESAAEQGAGVVPTNQTEAMTTAQFQTQICAQLTALFNCAQVTVELTPLPAGTPNLSSLLPQFDANGNLIGNPSIDVGAKAGAAGTDMLLVVMY